MENHDKNNGKALSIMMKMGYKEGSGLGKNETGIPHPISLPMQYDKRGFGSDLNNEIENSEVWMGPDHITIEENIIWIESENSQSSETFSSHTFQQFLNYILRAEPLTTLENEDNFCDPKVLQTVLKTKEDVFQNLDANDLSKARSRANQFETIKSAFFMNRAALKMANIDAATNFMFTSIDRDPKHMKTVGPYYFADVCAGPGGFSEYILWRKKWGFKGFGFTLRGVHDFKLMNSTCISDATFRSYYGAADDGNVCNPDNIEDFRKRVLHETKNEGVHFMMADGGFSVEGNEGIQEILSKQIYICQCLVALEIVRKNGHFVTKLFDVFTAFSVGLIFLLFHCFEKVALLKPNSSRPANSERYFICSGLKDIPLVNEVRKYLRHIVKELWTMRNVNKQTETDIIEIVPVQLIKDDEYFYTYIRSQNTKMARTQIGSLQKLAAFCKNHNLIDNKQVELRAKCLEYWRIPNKMRAPQEKYTIDDLMNSAISKPEFLYVQPCIIDNNSDLHKHILDINDWTYMPLHSSKTNNCCHIFAGVGNSVAFKLQNFKWIKVKGLKLIKGTLLYGEIVTEKCTQSSSEKTETKALHVIDALRLGETSLADFAFQDRANLIRTYCQSINFETVGCLMRIRPKPSAKLAAITQESLVSYSVMQDSYYSLLPSIGFESTRELFDANSILLLKTDETHYFNTTYVLRAQLFIDKFEVAHDVDKYDTFLQYIRGKSS